MDGYREKGKGRGKVVAAIVYVLVSLVSTQFPLLNTLGYEFSFVIAIVASFVSAFVTISLVKPAYVTSSWPGRETAASDLGHNQSRSFHLSIFPSFLSSLSVNFLLLLIPLLVIFINGFFVRPCSILEGLAFYILLPVVSVWVSSSLAFFCLVHYRRSRTMFVLIVGMTIVYAGALGYYTPSIFSYNLFYGFFPGLSYDELLAVEWVLVLFRAITVLVGMVLVWLTHILLTTSHPQDSTVIKGRTLLRALFQGRRRYATGALGAMAVLLYVFRCDVGFESTASFIQGRLGGVFATEHFTIYYSPASYSDEEIRYVAADHEFHFQSILGMLYLPRDERITSYIYPSAVAKQRYIGTGTTNIAKPWNREIHLTKQSVDASLRHEMAHVLVGRFGVPVIHASTSTGLVEGVAMAIEDRPGNRTLHQYAAAMRRFGVAPDIRRLMAPVGFMSQASSVSYVLAGSLCRYLLDRHGIRPLLQVYGNTTYETAFDYPLDTLVGRWERFLDSLTVSTLDTGRIDVFFRGRPIFAKVCPRVIARRVREADRLYGDRKFAEAYRRYEETYAEGRGMESLRGMTVSLFRLGEYSRVVGLLDSVSRADAHPLRYLTLYIVAGDAAWVLGDTLKARLLYTAVRDADITEGFTEGTRVRLHMLSHASNQRDFLNYLLLDGSEDDRLAFMQNLSLQSGDSVLCRYVAGRVHARMGKHAQAAQTLMTVTWGKRDPHLEAVRQRTIANALLHMGAIEEGKALLWSSLNGESNEQTLKDVSQAIDKCEWMLGVPFLPQKAPISL